MDTLSEPPRLVEYLDKNNLMDNKGRLLREFKRTLKPRWGILWLELLLGHLALIITLLIIIRLDTTTSIFSLSIVIIVGAMILGVTHAYIQLFFHEAAHGNIANNRKLNDFLANSLIGIFIGQDIKIYRSIHFKHHQQLGTIEDTERTYFDALNRRFIVESLTGVKVMKVLWARKKTLQKTNKIEVLDKKNPPPNKQFVLGMLLHLVVLSIAIKGGHWGMFFAWGIGMGIILPFFIAVRQVLEHRGLNAKSNVDYRIVPQGATHRLFGDSLLARILGGAGFNRHLLHHWEPQISYTQLRNLEKFLLQTPAADFIQKHQTTYLATFLQLMRAS